VTVLIRSSLSLFGPLVPCRTRASGHLHELIHFQHANVAPRWSINVAFNRRSRTDLARLANTLGSGHRRTDDAVYPSAGIPGSPGVDEPRLLTALPVKVEMIAAAITGRARTRVGSPERSPCTRQRCHRWSRVRLWPRRGRAHARQLRPGPRTACLIGDRPDDTRSRHVRHRLHRRWPVAEFGPRKRRPKRAIQDLQAPFMTSWAIEQGETSAME
jgi:hypothetical protein